jgi:alpha-ketoglutarate-dependent taurine dioxygenase
MMDTKDGDFATFLAGKNSTVLWHSDVTYDEQPPGMTILYALELPEVGGDTAFTNQVEAYQRLSPALRERLHGLKGVHDGVSQAEPYYRAGRLVRRKPVIVEHPLVRTHPVTGEKALFVNACRSLSPSTLSAGRLRTLTGTVTTRIVGMKKEESDMLLGFLMNHIGHCLEHQVRVRWEPKTVVIWDVSTPYTVLLEHHPDNNRTVSLRTLRSSTGGLKSVGTWHASLPRLSVHLRRRIFRKSSWL